MKNVICSTEIGVEIDPFELKMEGLMQTFEELRINDPNFFSFVINKNKEFIELIYHYVPGNEILLETITNEIHDITYLYWSIVKGLKFAVENIEQNLKLIHFLVIKLNFTLEVPLKSVIIEFIKVNSQPFYEIDDLQLNYKLAVLDILIINGKADINAKDQVTENTALHHAVINKHYPFVINLLKNGINFDSVNKKGETALDIAIKNNDEISRSIADILTKFGA